MNLYDKIRALYPSLVNEDFIGPSSTISIRSDSNGENDYIAKWEHLTLTRPTQAQLDEVTE
jgi:hypothetical protein